MGLYKREGSEHWWCRFQIAGHEIRQSTRTADRRAAQIEERRLRNYHEGQAPNRRSGKSPRLAELAGLDAERAVAHGATPQHIKALIYQWKKITSILGPDLEPRAINHNLILQFIAARRSQGALGQTISREVQALRRICVDAHRRGWLPTMPLDWPKVKRDAPREARKGRLHPPAILAQWLAQLPQDARDEAELALFTGLRSAELKRMMPGWVEPAPQGSGVPAQLRLPAAMAKSRKERIVPLVPRAFAIIERRAKGLHPGLTLLGKGSHKTTYKAAARRIGYSSPISLRDLRHTWGTLIARSGGVDTARDGLGHSNLSTTNRYVSGDLSRLASATLDVELAMSGAQNDHASRHSKVGTVTPSYPPDHTQVVDFIGAGKGARTLDPQLGKVLPALLDHLSTCNRCASIVQACSNLKVIDGHVGTDKSAQLPPLSAG